MSSNVAVKRKNRGEFPPSKRQKGEVPSTSKRRKKKHKKNKEKVSQANETARPSRGSAFQLPKSEECDHKEDGLVWSNLGVPDTVVKALLELGYINPTPIQSAVLPPAINGRCDVLGAAQTGSGKTLAYGLPLLRHVLDSRTSVELSETTTDDDSPSPAVATVGETSESEHEDEDDGRGCGLVFVQDNIPDEEFFASVGNDMFTEIDAFGESVAIGENDASGVSSSARHSGVLGLVLTPTRELALQVVSHLQAVASHTDVKFIALVGGMAIQKQERLLLSRRPEVVVATPGRLWAFMNEAKNAHLNTIRKSLQWLVIDEADRMISQGHFAELELILSALPKEVHILGASKPYRRQTLVFSATLTLVPTKSRTGEEQSLQKLAEKACISKKPKVIDLTKRSVRVGSLTETRLMCSSFDVKDVYLYHFLLSYRGRTIVFCNSIDCVHRLCGLLGLLKLEPLRLHANMQQRQRLKNLDRFASQPNALLVASDVAARGLDVKNVDHVIHYQVPRHPETYVHRSGRTARANRDGLSIMLISPDDARSYRQICAELNSKRDLSEFSVDLLELDVVRRRVSAARRLDQEQHKLKRSKHKANWFERQAQAMDIELDDDLVSESAASAAHAMSAEVQQRLARLRAELANAFRLPLKAASAHKNKRMR